jgi:cytochrome P450
MGAAWTIVFRDHDATHNEARRILRKGLAPSAIPHYRILIEAMAHKFLGEVVNRTLDISDMMQP